VRIGGTTARYVRDSTTVRIALPGGRGDTLKAEVRYGGTPTDGLVIGTDARGRWTAFGDNYPNRARHWLPTVDDPADKATVTWEIRAPVGVRAIANGGLLEESVEPAEAGEGPMVVTRWRADRPLYTSVMVIGVAPFAVFELGNTACGLGEHPGCVPQSVWVAPEVRGTMPGAFAKAGDIVQLFSRLVGPFPYEKLAHVQSATRWGGMENAGAIFYADGIFRKNTMSEGLIAHETAHQWFGDAVTEREWPDVWLSEGFATYFAALWTEHSKGDSAFRIDLREMRKDVLEAKISADEPVVRRSVPDMSKLLNSNVYQKAGFTLHMLRRQVGDSAFFRAIRAYYAKHRHGNATTADFRREVESTSGEDLGWFFEQWMSRPGFAALDAQWRYDPSRRTIMVTVSQSERFAPYRLSIPVEVTTQSGKTYRATLAVPATRVGTVPLDLRLDAEPRSVVFDPDVSVLGTITSR
jgi:aminopeptidase N